MPAQSVMHECGSLNRMRWCDLVLVTGTTVANGTIKPILELAGTKAVFYGLSIVGVARLLGLERFCPRST